MSKPTLVILAAGMGSRFGGLKQLEPVGPSGEAILDYSVYDAVEAGFGKVVFVIKKEMEPDFRNLIRNRFDKTVETGLAFQEPDMLPPGYTLPHHRKKPWGTAHAIMAAGHAVQTPFAVINADDFYGREAYEKLAAFFENELSDSTYSMIGYRINNTLSAHGEVSRAVCTVDSHQNLVSITERLKIAGTKNGIVYYDNGDPELLPQDAVVSMNIWGFHPSFFQFLTDTFAGFLDRYGQDPDAEFYTPWVVDQLINSNRIRVKVLNCNAQWFGITFPEDRKNVQDKIAGMVTSGIYPDKLW